MKLKEVTCKDGVYCWKCKTDAEFKQYEYSHAIRTGWIICGFMILLGCALVPLGEMFLILLLTLVIIVLIVFAVSRYILNRPGFETVSFRMTDKFIQYREGRGATFVSFKSVNHVETTENRVDLYTRFSKYPVYIPQEDFEFISSLIMRYVSEETR